MDLLEAMRAFVAVAEAGSFTAAAERRDLSRAMASKHVMDLEAHLGLRLLDRTTRSVGLTEAGATYAARCREIIDAIEAAEHEATSGAAEPVGRLRVSAPSFFGSRFIAPLIAQFAERHPKVGVELLLDDKFVDLVQEGCDLAIRIGRLEDSSLVASRIASAKLMVCGAPSYLDRRGRPRRPADLSEHECLRYSHATVGAAWPFDGPDGPELVRLSSRFASNNAESLCAMAAAGLGLVCAPDFYVAELLRAGELEQVLADRMIEPLGIFIVHPSRRHVPSKVRAFIEFVTLEFSQRPPCEEH
ncbi:LysR family transcriptional regulator [Methylosinus sp. Sm6]|uniref:LysR family transcriptional regulator n=1 Tax=Methylosinus sp. Sm6 TaxID=2866948 RepID=UPI001C99BA0A|nr:LysR family transcriptional regulator [Methylosinus sp. Sm6]MBY6241391.1 LysR family transcriptional regulator [Methylosinus sp. Sm6]